jgi:hypothetical protein
MRDTIISSKKKGIFNQTKSTTNVWGTCDIERHIVIYRPKIKKKECVNNGLELW